MSNTVADVIRAIADAHGGVVTPAQVVAAARDKDSPLHGHFTWDVKHAAQERWLDQARALIRSVKIEVTTTHFQVRAPAYIRDPSSAPKDQGYISVGRLRNDEDLARDAVIGEFKAASAALSRAKAVAAALGLQEQIEEIRSSVIRLTEHARQAAA